MTMTKNKKILFCTESSHLHSGFGNYSRAIISRLHAAGYNVAELSCYRSSAQPKTEPWKIYPAAIPKDHPNHKDYMVDASNQFGKFVFDFVVVDFKPDIVIDFRDFWMFAFQEISTLRKFFYWIIAPTIDSTPLLLDTMINFSNADMVLTHTHWASKTLKNLDKNNRLNLGGVIHDSVDSNIFKPIKNKLKHKLDNNISDNTFVIGSVLRNQKRKLIPELFGILKNLIDNNKTNKKILLYLHTSYPELNGWNIPELLLEYGVESNVLFTYKCKKCLNKIIRTYSGPNTVCNKCGSKAGMTSVTNGVTDHELCEIYNLFDIYIQYAICEGFGIPQVEAAACGLPLITVNHGAMKEIGESLDAYLVDVQKEFRETDSNAIRVYPNNNHAISIIQSLIDNDKLIDIGNNSRQQLLKQYSWDITANNLMNIIDNIKLNNISWDIPSNLDNIAQSTLNYTGDNTEFVEHVVKNIIKEPELIKTSYIKNIISNLDNGSVLTDKGAIPYDLNIAAKNLEIYLKTKILIENIRTKQTGIPEALSSIMNY